MKKQTYLHELKETRIKNIEYQVWKCYNKNIKV